MRSAVTALLVVVACGIAALVVVGALERRDLAFTLGVTYQQPLTRQAPGDELCQDPVHAAESFEAVRIKVGTYMRPGQPLRVELRRLGGGRVGGASVPAGYEDNEVLRVPVGTVPRETRFEVCVVNEGERPIALYGSGSLGSRSSEARLNGERTDQDMAIDFLRSDSKSLLSLAPDMAERASLFHGRWIGTWTIWLLTVLVVLAVPALLVLALRASTRCES